MEQPVVFIDSKWDDKWIEKYPTFLYFAPVSNDPSKVCCKICRTVIHLSTEGPKALKRHLRRSKHMRKWMRHVGVQNQGAGCASRQRVPERCESTSKHESAGNKVQSDEQFAVEVRTGSKHVREWMRHEGILNQGADCVSRKRVPERGESTLKHESAGNMVESDEQFALEVRTGSESLQNSGNLILKSVEMSGLHDHSCPKPVHEVPIILTGNETSIKDTSSFTAALVETMDANSAEAVAAFKVKSDSGVKRGIALRKENSQCPEREDISGFKNEPDVQDSEILWCLFCVRHRLPYRTFNTIEFQKMFPDIRSGLLTTKYNPDRLAYITNYGLELYYRTELLCILKKVGQCALVFKEIFCIVGGYKQIDMYIRFWNSDSHQVEMRYCISVFNKLDAQADDVAEEIWWYLKDFENCTEIIQMSCYGSHVTLQYLRCLQEKFEKHFSYGVIDLNNSLHSIYDAFESAEEASHWKLCDILRSLYLIFKDCPERCSEYVKITKSREFPLPFHNQRLLLNIQTAERAFEIWINIKKYIDFICTEYSSVSNSFAIVKEACNDVLMPVKLKLFISIGKRLESFINLFKCNKPMLPFFYRDLKAFENCCKYYCEIKRHSHSDVSSVDKLVDFELTNNSLPLLTEIRLGFSGEKLLKEMCRNNVTSIQVAVMKTSVQEFVLKLVEKLKNNPYLNNPLFEYLSCLDPLHMVSNMEDSVNKFSRVIYLFREKSHLCESMRQCLLEQFSLFLDDVILHHKSDFEKFDHAEDNCRLDTFLHNYLSDVKYEKLWHFLTRLLVLFNGQVDLPRYFAPEEYVAFEQVDVDYTARRFISDHLMWSDDVAVVTDKMRVVVNKALRNRVDIDSNANQPSS